MIGMTINVGRRTCNSVKLTSRCRTLLEKCIGIQSVKKLRLEGSLKFSMVTEVFGPQS
jgi:hypothetical protein